MELTPQQWETVKELFESAVDQPPADRVAFLAANSDEAAVRQEVERLLASHNEAGDFLSALPLPSTTPAGGRKPNSDSAHTFTPGDLLAERFRVTRFLARGGMGEVYEAEDVELHERVALKTIRAEVLRDTHALERFKREVHLAKQVTHPNVCRIFDLFRHQVPTQGDGGNESVLLVAMELLEGETLAGRLERERKLTTQEAGPIALQMAAGLGAAHEAGVLHRDFKPGNVVLTPVAKGVRAVITDFGLAQRPGSESSLSGNITETGAAFGTPAYMSPEQVEGKDLTPATDVYSLGLVLYRMLSGERPFEGTSPLSVAVRRVKEDPTPLHELVPDVNRRWEEIILHCLERDPKQRFQTANEVAQALRGEIKVPSPPRSRRMTADISYAGAKPRNFMLPALGLLVAVAIVGLIYYRSHRPLRLTEKDTVILADFTNSTGDPVFDDTLKQTVSIALRQSPFLYVISEGKVAATLELMTRPADASLTPEVAHEVCQRTGSKAYITGGIAPLGQQYVLSLKAIDCHGGETLAQQQAVAESKEKVVNALGRAAAQLRRELGESLATVQKFDVPLSQATTSSLDALKAYSLGVQAGLRKSSTEAIAHCQRAIELDPNFAAAYRGLASSYASLGETSRASQYLAKAFELRDHASEREKLAIAADYYRLVSGELDKAAQVYQELVESYPRENTAYNNFGIVYAALAQYEKAEEAERQALRLAPDRGGPYMNLGNLNLGNFLLAQQRIPEAQQIAQDALARKLDDYILRNELYAVAFITQNAQGLAEQRLWFEKQPDAEHFGLSLDSDTEASAGHLQKARELTRRSVESAIHADSPENAAIWMGNAALREAAFGNAAEARRDADEAMKTEPSSQGVQLEVALSLAMAGESDRAESLARELNRKFPLDTQVQSLWLPVIRGQLALNREDSNKAIDQLRATGRMDLAQIQFVNNISCLYSVYIRGQAYLAARQGAPAAGEFHKILDHSGIVWNCWTGALAHLGVARASALQARASQGADSDAARVRALAAYKDFLTLWKDADPDIPILKEAKAEYARLQ